MWYVYTSYRPTAKYTIAFYLSNVSDHDCRQKTSLEKIRKYVLNKQTHGKSTRVNMHQKVIKLLNLRKEDFWGKVLVIQERYGSNIINQVGFFCLQVDKACQKQTKINIRWHQTVSNMATIWALKDLTFYVFSRTASNNCVCLQKGVAMRLLLIS